MSKIHYGTNGKGSINARVSLKPKELEKYNITQEEPEIKIKYCKDYIKIIKEG